MAIDTVMLSFCEDCEAHGGEPRKAPPLLLHALHTAAAAEEDRAAHRWGSYERWPAACPLEPPPPHFLWQVIKGHRFFYQEGLHVHIVRQCLRPQRSACGGAAQVGQEGARGGRGDAGPARDLGRQGAAQPALPAQGQGLGFGQALPARLLRKSCA